MTDVISMIEGSVAALLYYISTFDERQVLEAIDTVSKFHRVPLTEAQCSELVRRIHAQFDIRMDAGVAITGSDLHQPWVAARKARDNNDTFFWDRFRSYQVQQGWSTSVLRRVDSNSDEILDQFGDPEKTGAWQRRGLVIGDVQSGKTANYTALICKAADAGYRVVVLLTGTLENLRQQTQERLDHGFIGLDSALFIDAARLQMKVGVGVVNPTRTAVTFTSRTADFRNSTMRSLGLTIKSIHEPVVLVVKKNKRVLSNLTRWLRTANADRHGLIDAPALFIDDEADNASVNTNAADESPTAINEQIRDMLKLFSRNTYVGFTATPFANIFIDPESESGMLGHDLFPRDFIYALEAPSNYVGPSQIFGSDSVDLPLQLIEDSQALGLVGHSSDYVPESLPSSMVEAIQTFLLCIALRDIAGLENSNTHRSMLVNVSHFTDVQNRFHQLIDGELRKIQSAVRLYSQLPVEEARRQSEVIQKLEDVWRRQYQDQAGSIEWSDVLRVLHRAIAPVVARVLNQKSADRLNYSENSEHGLRVIAVGGNSLARGLTLEGLCVSYFLRNTRMYDTLLQMGRWFGYRPGYAQYCRVWMSEEALYWFRHISEVSEELRSDVRRMKREGLTPRNFGLRVRAHPNALLVTASNKMLSAKDVEYTVSFSGAFIETAELPRDPSLLHGNYEAAQIFIAHLQKTHSVVNNRGYIWTEVPRELVARFLRNLEYPKQNLLFERRSLDEFISENDVEQLASWDVFVPSLSSGPDCMVGQTPVKLRSRHVELRSTSIYVNGSSRRVGEPMDEAAGIDAERLDEIKNNYAQENPGKNVPGREYRRYRSRPLLIVNLVRAVTQSDVSENLPPLVAVGLCFPVYEEDAAKVSRVRYKINMVEYRSISGYDEQGDDVASDGAHE